MRRLHAGTIALRTCVVLLLAGAPASVYAGVICPDSMYATVSFSQTFTGIYRTGEPFDVLTVAPDGEGDTFASTGIAVDVYVRNCQGVPLVGFPAEDIVLFSSSLCYCPPGWKAADAPTDINGHTQFTGSLRAGGCANSLTVFVDGIAIASLPIKINSPVSIPSHCVPDASCLAALASRLGSEVGESNYAICFDYTEDGYVDASDLASFADHLGRSCK